jgi:hypothetical protein
MLGAMDDLNGTARRAAQRLLGGDVESHHPTHRAGTRAGHCGTADSVRFAIDDDGTPFRLAYRLEWM